MRMTSAPDAPRIPPDAAGDAPGERRPGEDLKTRQETLIDEALEESFPASDPASPEKID